MITKLTLTALVFVLLLTSCNKAGNEETPKVVNKGASHRVSGFSAGDMHNYILDTYDAEYGLDTASSISRTEFDSMLHRCMRIAIADSIVFGGNPEDEMSRIMYVMDSLDMFDGSGNCRSDSSWTQVCEASIANASFRLAVHNINQSPLTGTDFLNYADNQLQHLSGLTALDSIGVEGYSSVLHSSYQYWSNYNPHNNARTLTAQDVKVVARSDARGFVCGLNNLTIWDQALGPLYCFNMCVCEAAVWSQATAAEILSQL